MSDRVDCLRATKLVVNQDGVYGLNIGLLRGRMTKLEAIEVEMRDSTLNAQYASPWVRTALEKSCEVVKCDEGAKGYESNEFAFGYLHSFLGWELPGAKATTEGHRVRLFARQEVTVWAEKRSIARLVSPLARGCVTYGC